MTDEFNESRVEVLEKKADELAQSHRLSSAKPTSLPLLVALAKTANWFNQVKQSLDTTDLKSARAAEWIFDNSYLLERTLQQIKVNMPDNYYTLLPTIQSKIIDEHLPRAYRIAGGFLAADGIQIALPLLVKFIKEYQKDNPLDISELWALPSFLRLVCLELVISAVVRIVPEIDLPYDGDKLRKPFEISLDEVDCLGRAIHCLAEIETIPWQKFFEQVNVVELELRKDPANIYASMDFESRDRYCDVIEHLARTTPQNEQFIAQRVVALASESITLGQRLSHVGYWLVDKGRVKLEQELGYSVPILEGCKRALAPHKTALYFFLLFCATAITESVAGFYLIQNQANAYQLFAGLLLSFVPASMISVSFVNWLITTIKRPRVLNKLDFEKSIDPNYATAVVVPSLLGSDNEIDSLLTQIERHYLCNPDPALSFVLLTDFLDAPTPELLQDKALIQRMREGVVRLNQKYPGTGKGMFHLLHRQRRFNSAENCWMGWERKRGKLDAFNRLLCAETSDDFSVHEGDLNGLTNIRFVITLDSDTQLFRGAAARLIGTLAHPLNRAVFNEETGEIISGYTVIQPRIEIDPSRATNTWFSRVASGDRVIDIYTQAVSEVYQDLFGCGIFVGKGIYDLAAFKRSLEHAIPENTILSHDLLEGILGHSALASDIVLYEDFPTQYLAFSRRFHRWVRGDWQLVPWLTRKIKRNNNSDAKNPIIAIDRWKIIDNLRRSLFSPMLILWLIAGWVWLPGNPLVWTLLGLLSPIFHNVGNILFGIVRSTGLISLLQSFSVPTATLGRWFILIVFLPHETMIALDAIIRTLFRLMFSRKNLLQWVSAEHTNQLLKKNGSATALSFWIEMAPSLLLTATIALVIIYTNPSALPIAAPLLITWLLAPEIARRISHPIERKVELLSGDDVIFLRRLARHTWLFFETFVGPVDHWLPPDNFQEDPHGVISHRTSPTNIGMMFLANLSAWDFGYLGPTDFASRTLASLNTVSSLEHYRGHLFNWYNTQTFEILPPSYVSTVDSGNLAACLLALEEGCDEIRNTAIFTRARWDGLMDIIALIEESLSHLGEDKHLKGSSEYHLLITQAAAIRHKAWIARENSDAWWLTVEELTEYDFVKFDNSLVESLAKKSLTHKVQSLRDIRIWVGRAHQHLRDMLRDMDRLLPWLTKVTCSISTKKNFDSAEYHSTLRQLDRVLLPTLTLAEIIPACLQARDIITQFYNGQTKTDSLTENISIKSWFQKLESSLEMSIESAQSLLDNLNEIAQRAKAEVIGMDFDLLFDENSQIFHIGYNASAASIDPHHYDLLASEARLASIVALGKGDVSTKHWFALGRAVTKVSGRLALLSWGGTMFEYLMPRLLLPSADGTLLADSEQAVVNEQIKLAGKRKIPWGISESGYAAIDHQHNYQYKAFGVPSMGYKRGLELDSVVAPYASALALAIYPVQACDNLKQLTKLGMLGIYGLYEAADYTSSRVPTNRQYATVQSHMAHHQGMILVALDNALLKNPHVRRFQANAAFQSVELLLHEKLPATSSLEFPIDTMTSAEKAGDLMRVFPALDSWKPALRGDYPQLHVIGNSRLASLISDSGSGGLSWRNNALTRWSPDITLDNQGFWMYLKDEESGNLWSAGRQPSGEMAEKYEVKFSAHMAEISRQDFGIGLKLEVTVAAHDDVEVRRVTLKNETNRIRRLSLTSFAEVVLTRPNEDERHPAFSKLFVHSELVSIMNALIFERRSRSPQENPPALLHRILAESQSVTMSGFETDRERFIGRNGNARKPRGVMTGLTETLGWTLDPVMSLQASVELAPYASEVVSFITIASGSRRSLLDIAHRYETLSSVDLLFYDAKSKASSELQKLKYAIPFLPGLQQLLSLLMQPHKSLRASDTVISNNRLSQPALWSFGVSGDWPILLLRQLNVTDVTILRVLISAHQRWRQQGLNIDLVIMHESTSGYVDEIRDQVQQLLHELGAEAMLAQRGGIHLLHLEQMSKAQQNLLNASAHVVLNNSDPLAQQLAFTIRKPDYLPSFRGTMRAPTISTIPAIEHQKDLAFYNGLGGFSANGDEYIIYLEPGQSTPAPWCNVIANASLGCLTSEIGGGYTWAVNSGENRITEWMNDPVEDPPSEIIYLRDEESAELWTVTNNPIGTGSRCEITHGAGYSVWRSHSHNLEQELQVSVADEDPVKITRLRLHNTSATARRLTVTYYAELVLGVTRHKNSPYIVTEFDPATNAIMARNNWNNDFSERVAFLCSDHPVHGFTTDRTEFLGREGRYEHPAGLYRWGLNGTTGAALDPCAALQVHLDLPANSKTELLFLLGQGDNVEHAQALVEKWQQPQTYADDWLVMRSRWQRLLGSLTVQTPEPAFDCLMNQWLIYQTLACRVLARTGLYQSSGAYGFRDQLQDIMALIPVQPSLARKHILECAAHQFELGDVLHWWHPPNDRGVRTRCSDDMLWLPFVTAHYVETSGDVAILEEKIPFLVAEPLAAHEENRYSQFDSSSEKVSLFEHCRRALDFGIRSSGEHGLLLINGGDWNDGMDRVGARGKGESIWLTWFAIAVVESFCTLNDRIHKNDYSANWRARARELGQAIETSGWDGKWYRRAYDDDSLPWGAEECQECRIDSIAQSWATLSGAAEKARSVQALESAEKELIDTDNEIVRLLWPPFDTTMRDPGYIKAYPPGIRENGGQYTHAAVWLAWAQTVHHKGDAAFRIMQMLNPINHSLSLEKTGQYRLEPYVLAGDVGGIPPHEGRGGWSWYTGSASWAYRLGSEAILGIRYKGTRLLLDPCIPKSWNGFTATLRRDGGIVELSVENTDGPGYGIVELLVDGERIKGNEIELPQNGETRQVVVKLGVE